MATCIPDFAERIEPLRKILEEAYEKSGSRKKKKIESMRLDDLSWGPEHTSSFQGLQRSLQNAVTLSHRDSKKSICIFTDASDTHWAAVVTQCEPDQLNQSVMKQSHEPLAFLSSAFRRHESRWSTYEKEGFAIYQVFRKLDYMLMVEDNIQVFTDHRNFLFVFDPLSVEPSLGRYIVTKVQRWALYLSMFQYSINHVPGEENVMADIMTRWLSGYRRKTMSARRVRRISELLEAKDLIPKADEDTLELFSLESILKAQSTESPPAGSVSSDDGPLKLNGKIWIPNKSHEVQLGIITAAHCGSSGHRGIESTLAIAKEEFTWQNMRSDVTEFVKQCIHCMVGKGGSKVPRPLSETLHGTLPNQVVHFDYLFMGHGINDMKYLLVIKDDISSYCWLCPSQMANSEHTAKELSRWIQTFTAMDCWVSDQGSHFKNMVLKGLAEDYKIRHHFTVAYSPWVNGTVENLMQHILACCQSLLSESKYAPQDWPLVTNTIMTALNETPLRRLGSKPDGSFYSPLEVMTGLAPHRQQMRYTDAYMSNTPMQIDMIRLAQSEIITNLQNALSNMHKNVEERVSRLRSKAILEHNRKTFVISPNFVLGDFVMVRKPNKKGHKNSFRWTGPRRITGVISSVVYNVSKLFENSTDRVHASRLRLYRKGSGHQNVSSNLLAQAKHLETQFDLIDKIVNIGQGDSGILLQVKWQGLPDEEDWTWQDVSELYEDVPEEVLKYLNTISHTEFATQAKKELGLSRE